MKILRIAIIILLINIIALSVSAQINRDEAIELITEQLLVDELESVNVHMLPELAYRNNPLTLRDGRTFTLPYNSNWLFFVDDHPGHDWAHPCRYISVDFNSGEYQIIEEYIYPLRLNNDYDAISTVPLPIIEPVDYSDNTTTEFAPINPHLYAVIVCPTNYHNENFDDTRHWNHTSIMFTTLKEKYGYSEDNIFVHYIDGLATLGNGNNLDNTGNANDIDYDSRKVTLQNTFNELAGITDNDPYIPQLTEKDQLFVFLTDHGFTDDVNSFIFVEYTTDEPVPDDYIMWDYELANFLAPINSAHLIVVIQACFSGGFSNELVDYDNYNVLCKNRTIHTSSDFNYSWLNNSIYNNNMSEFIMHWQAATRGYYSFEFTPWETWHGVENFPFSEFYSNHPGPRNPDSNEDGISQLSEVFSYAYDYDEYCNSEHGGYFNSGTHTEIPQNGVSFGFQENNLLSLHGMGGVVTHTQNVEGNFLVTSDLIIDNNAIVTISSNSSFHLYGDSKIIVNEGSSLILEDNVSITREGSNEGIQVNGELIVGDIALLADLIVKTNGTLKLTSNLTIRNNTDLVLENGAVVSGDENYPNTLTINGDLNALNGVTFNNISSSGNGEIIIDNEDPVSITSCEFNTSNLTGHLTFSNIDIEQTTFDNSYVELDLFSDFTTGLCEISNSTFENHIKNGVKLRPALRIEDFTMYRINGNTFKNNTSDGIAVYNSGNLNYPARSIYENRIFNNKNNTSATAKGIIIYSSVADIYDNLISLNDYGVATYHNSNVKLYGKRASIENEVYQMIYSNEVNQVLAGEQSFPWYFTYNVINETNNPNPRVYSTDRAPSSPYNIERNCWGDSFTPASDLAPLSYYDYLPIWDCGLNPGGPILIEEPRLAYETSLASIEEENYTEAETQLKTIVTTWPESSFAGEAMKTMQTVAIETNTLDELVTYYNTNSTIKASEGLAKLAGYLVADTKIIQKEYQDALSHYEEIIANPPTEEDYIYAVIDAGRVQYLMEEEGGKAAISFKYSNLIPDTKKAYKENRRVLLDGIKGEIDSENINENIYSEFTLPNDDIRIYPNPVRKKAVIEMNVGVESNVTIELLDVSGKLVKQDKCLTTSNGKLYYDLSTDGIDNGVYFVKISFNNNQRIDKIVIVK